MRLYRWMYGTEPVALAGNTYKIRWKNRKKNITKTNLTKNTHREREIDMFMQGAEDGLFTNIVNNFGVTAHYGLYLLCHVLTQFADPTENQQRQYNACKGGLTRYVRTGFVSFAFTHTCVRCMCLCVCVYAFFFHSFNEILI